jgi:hypothetical protein
MYKAKRLSKNKFYVQVQEQDLDTGVVIHVYACMYFYSRNKAIAQIDQILNHGLKKTEIITNAKSWYYPE